MMIICLTFILQGAFIVTIHTAGYHHHQEQPARAASKSSQQQEQMGTDGLGLNNNKSLGLLIRDHLRDGPRKKCNGTRKALNDLYMAIVINNLLSWA